LTPSQIGITRIRTVLERELEKRSQSQKKTIGIERMGEEDADQEMGGLECTTTGPFKFSDWEYGEVAFLGSYVKVERDDLGSMEKSVMEEKEKESPQIQGGLQDFRDWIEQLAS
jgi:signal recognition particle receptor subunit beta